MLKQTDHPLDHQGRLDAEKVRDHIKAGKKKYCKETEQLLKTNAVWTSPLTRAIETCLIGMRPVIVEQHPASPGSAKYCQLSDVSCRC